MKKGFTLIELLVVIAILAVLMSVIVITLNPAEMLKKTRDTKRISDLDALRTAINLYITDVASPSMGSTGTCYTHFSNVTGLATSTTGGTNCPAYNVTTTPNLVTGSGWIPINFTAISSGSPLSALPVDPKPTLGSSLTGTNGYFYKASSTAFEMIANMESSYYANGGTGDIESKDGGNSADLYEIGSDLTLI